MKKSLLLSLAVIASFVLNAQTVQRTVLVESFTNASCPPCAAQNPGFNVLLGNNTDKVAVIKYQTNWPGYDPMNEQNPTEVATRVSYYGVTGVPNVRIDGTTNAGTSGSVTQAMINTAYGIPSPLQITLTHSLSADLSQITINCDITNPNTTFGWSAADAKLRIGLIEKDLQFPTPPGSTNETHFNYVMRKMYPDATGTAVAPIPAGGTANYTWTVDLPTYLYNYTQIGVVAFVQSEGAKTVYQAAISQPQPLPGAFPDAAFSISTQGPTSLCEYGLTPSATVTNEGGIDITSFDVSYTLNGAPGGTQNWTGALAPGSAQAVNFPAITLGGGSTVVEYTLTNLNGGAQDINSLNDAVSPQTFNTLSPTPVGTSLLSDMETGVAEGAPAYAIINRAAIVDLMVVDQPWLAAAGAPGATGPVGGFAASAKSLLAGFWWTPPGTSTSIVFDKIDWSNNTLDSITFDLAYRQYIDENDRLLVHISTDCGVTWTNVYDKGGAALATVGASQTFFVPTAAQWRKEAIDVSAFDGSPEVVVRFTAVAAFGNNLYLDNINIFGTVTSGVEDAIVESKVNIYPNPASSQVNVEFNMVKANSVTVQVYDVTGKLVTTLLNNQVLGAGAQNVQWNNPASAGLYFVKIRTEEGEITRKVSILK